MLALLLTLALVLAAVASAAGGGTGGSGSSGGGSQGGGGGGGKRHDPYRGQGMWIWYVKKSSGGKLSRIASKAKSHGIRTLYIKSSDGTSAWDQFTRPLVSYFHRHGLRVCAWQYVYGSHPAAEAKRGAEAVNKGADCLVIDAESEYEGRYAAADTYVDKLRHRVGRHFPTALASFPYVDYHPGLPYSVFLGPGGARFNLPQVYWHAIGVGVGEADRHTLRYNRVYKRPIDPIGQTYRDPSGRPTRKQIRKFRRLAISFDFHGISWWSWQHTSRKQWRALGEQVDKGVPGVRRGATNYPVLSKGSEGDLVVWVQEHLRGAGAHVGVTGLFARKTYRAVRRFQRAHGLRADGVLGARTWRKLLRVKPDMVDWSSKGHGPGKLSPAQTPAAPRSASLPAVRYEIPSAGRG
jgi:Putative peptidoglycan binding domain